MGGGERAGKSSGEWRRKGLEGFRPLFFAFSPRKRAVVLTRFSALPAPDAVEPRPQRLRRPEAPRGEALRAAEQVRCSRVGDAGTSPRPGYPGAQGVAFPPHILLSFSSPVLFSCHRLSAPHAV